MTWIWVLRDSLRRFVIAKLSSFFPLLWNACDASTHARLASIWIIFVWDTLDLSNLASLACRCFLCALGGLTGTRAILIGDFCSLRLETLQIVSTKCGGRRGVGHDCIFHFVNRR